MAGFNGNTLEIIVQRPVLEILDEGGGTLLEVSPEVPVIELFTLGAQGAAGQDGTVARYVHTQLSALNPWVINHNLGRRPATVRVTTVGGVEIQAAVHDISDNQLEVHFGLDQTGVAYIQ